MKLNAICLVKNEDDIIEQTLTYATRHCDRIFVIDNGSTDRTWEITRELAGRYPQIVPFEQTTLPYDDGLRARVYNQVHGEFTDDDWWMILDSDEFLAEDPKPVIETAVRQKADIIRSWQIQFYFTERDLKDWEEGRDSNDRPIFQRRRHYLINWQEPRLFRNQRTRPWNALRSSTVPDGLKKVCRRRILNRHYQFRDPEQIEKRLRLRFGHPSFRAHVRSAEWRSVVRDSRELCRYVKGESWRFKFAGVAYYYRKSLYNLVRAKYQGGLGKLRKVLLMGKGKNGI